MIAQKVTKAMKIRAAQPFFNLHSLERVLVGSLGDAWPYLSCAAIDAYEAALAEAGYEIVPRKPTPPMIKAGALELIRYDNRFDSYESGAGEIFEIMCSVAREEDTK